MATFVYNPKKDKVVEAQRKGKNKGETEQKWLDKEDNTKFTTRIGAEELVDQETGKMKSSTPTTQQSPSQQKSQSKKSSSSKAKSDKSSTTGSSSHVTELYVNSSRIKTVNGDLSVNEACDMLADYFKSISSDKSTVKRNSGKTVIQFTISTGSKS